jgi:Ca2+-binding EF-hand superfamily protein
LSFLALVGCVANNPTLPGADNDDASAQISDSIPVENPGDSMKVANPTSNHRPTGIPPSDLSQRTNSSDQKKLSFHNPHLAERNRVKLKRVMNTIHMTHALAGDKWDAKKLGGASLFSFHLVEKLLIEAGIETSTVNSISAGFNNTNFLACLNDPESRLSRWLVRYDLPAVDTMKAKIATLPAESSQAELENTIQPWIDESDVRLAVTKHCSEYMISIADTDKDGTLSKEEFLAELKMFKEDDPSSMGRFVNQFKAHAQHEQLFNTIDAMEHKDGKITVNELARIFEPWLEKSEVNMLNLDPFDEEEDAKDDSQIEKVIHVIAFPYIILFELTIPPCSEEGYKSNCMRASCFPPPNRLYFVSFTVSILWISAITGAMVCLSGL